MVNADRIVQVGSSRDVRGKTVNIPAEEIEGRPLCDVKYESKFKRWYGSELLSLEIDQVIRIKSINESWNKNIVEYEEDFE